MGKIAMLPHKKICIIQVMILLWPPFSSKHPVPTHPKPTLSIFGELEYLIDTPSV